MSLSRRHADRARSYRARHLWWEQHGGFVRGLVTGVLITLLGLWIASAVRLV